MCTLNEGIKDSMSQFSAFFFTLFLEGGFAVFWILMPWSKEIQMKQFLLTTLCASCITHPCAWILNEVLIGQTHLWIRLGIVEGIVIAIEGGVYTYLVPLSLRHGLILSVLSNCFSFIIGVELLIGW